MKLKCIKDILPFVCGNEYKCDTRLFTNKYDKHDVQVMLIEKEINDEYTCYLLSVYEVYEHFEIIKQ